MIPFSLKKGESRQIRKKEKTDEINPPKTSKKRI